MIAFCCDQGSSWAGFKLFGAGA